MGTTRLALFAALMVISAACSDAGGDPVLAETSTTAAAPDSDSSTMELAGLEGPPALVVDNGRSTVEAHGFDYCWDPGGCADSFGTEVPTPIDVDTQTVLLSWIGKGDLSATYQTDEEACRARLSLDAVGPETWSLAMPPEPGTHRIDLHGEAEEGTTRFAILVSSSVAGPPLLPIASVGWPTSEAFTDDAFLIGVEFYGIDPGSEAEIQILSSDQVSTVLPLQMYTTAQEGSACVRWIEGETAAIEGASALGATPLDVTLLLRDGTGRYKASWEWPRDIGPNGYRTSTLRPVPSVNEAP